jgi:hypothetical protein
MEAFEPIRDVASRLHFQFAAARASRKQPMELVDAALTHLNLELAWLPSGDPALKGARRFRRSKRHDFRGRYRGAGRARFGGRARDRPCMSTRRLDYLCRG